MRKNASDGKTSQNTEYDISMILALSLLSEYIQMKASIEVRGNDTSKDAHNGNRCDTSETAATINAVRSVFKTKYPIPSFHTVLCWY